MSRTFCFDRLDRLNVANPRSHMKFLPIPSPYSRTRDGLFSNSKNGQTVNFKPYHKLAANPCPCAPADPKDCICAPMAKRRYLGKLSGPLLDRVDLRVEMHTARAGAFAVEEGESTAVVRERVAAARAVAEERWRPHGIRTNAEVSGALLRRKFRPEAAAMEPLRTALDRGLLSIRGVDRTLRVAWTIKLA